MKLLTAALVSAVSCYTELAAAANGFVYTHEPSSSPDQVAAKRTLSAETARLVLAQRAGVEDFHIEQALSQDDIDAINDYGIKRSMLGWGKKDKKAFLLAFGDEEVPLEAVPKNRITFTVSDAPSGPATESFFYDIAAQLDTSFTVPNEAGVDALTSDGDLFYLGKDIKDVAEHYEQLAEEGSWSITVLMMPSKSSESAEWGTYSMPNTQSPLRNRRQAEKPLSDTRESAPEPTTAFVRASDDDESTPLRGILPACFSSKSECESTTRNCTGHGSCRLAYSDKDAGGESGDCYSCQCSATKVDNGDGRIKTTNWGGPACQKKDVSVGFWLISLFTVGLVFLISFAVGNLLDMGSEELPSVIGAGVSGPVRK